ncbi:hypothetical protein BU17DRAFT_38802 [Hysterangium stoloniferum]|nr:hypothetical protein BU17DRAFT_38802 [Hysterangium stoloniferum]
MSFGRPPTFSSFQATAPDRGSFPLDHEGECSTQMQVYLSCLQKSANNSVTCRQESKGYLECRMSRGLMQREDWKSLGMADVQNLENSCTTCSRDSNLDNEKKK